VSTEENKLPPGEDKPALPPTSNGESEAHETPADGELEDKRMSLMEHLQELRIRLRNAAVAFLVAMLAAFAFVEKFFQVLARPIINGIKAAGADATLQVTSPTEGFWVMMKLAIVGGLIVAAPLVFWEIWKFVAPGLYKKERRVALTVTTSTALCFAGGSVFGYFVLAQPAGYFLTKMTLGFAHQGEFKVLPIYRLEDVANFLMLTLAGCGVSFELPVLLVLFGAIGLVSARGLWKFNKYALILAAVAGAVLTPSTDPFTQLLLAGPLFGLYNVSILVVWLIERARKKRDDQLEESNGV
jgi:sec-independent protein translocase protein TatC